MGGLVGMNLPFVGNGIRGVGARVRKFERELGSFHVVHVRGGTLS